MASIASDNMSSMFRVRRTAKIVRSDRGLDSMRACFGPASADLYRAVHVFDVKELHHKGITMISAPHIKQDGWCTLSLTRPENFGD